jgi:hypothetical protein
MSLLLRCQFTGNPVGTDTRMFGADPCPCPGCKAHAEIERLRESGQSFQREAGRQCALRMEASEEVERAIDHGSAWPSLQGNEFSLDVDNINKTLSFARLTPEFQLGRARAREKERQYYRACSRQRVLRSMGVSSKGQRARLESGLRLHQAIVPTTICSARARVRALWGLSGWRGNERIADSIKKGPPFRRAAGVLRPVRARQGLG